jgi:hypothetical protein
MKQSRNERNLSSMQSAMTAEDKEGRLLMKSARYMRVTLLSGATMLSQMALHARSQPIQRTDETTDTPDNGVSLTVEGLVRDLACSIQNHNATATNFDLNCARGCIRVGSPLVILTKTGAMYFPISDKMPDIGQREKFLPFVGEYVRVNGTVFRQRGTRAKVIKSIVEVKDVKLKTQ